MVAYMKSQEVNIYRGIQKNTENGIKAMETLADKVYDEELALQISRQSLKYSEFRNEAMKQLVESKTEPYHRNFFSDMKVKAGLHYNTLLNTSTAHIAELMIKESYDNMLEMEKTLFHNKGAEEGVIKLARNFLEFEEKNIKCLKNYL